MADLETQEQRIINELAQQESLRLVITQLEEFAAKVKDGLTEADWDAKRDLIRTLVKRVEISRKDVRIVFRVTPDPFDPNLDRVAPRANRLSR